jgi:(E)-4-hydroxy-3-methylbut-2-enyl-diphosphate synthase
MSKKTRIVQIGDLKIGGGNPIAVQSMCATRTRDVEATVQQVKALEKVGADLVRVAVDNTFDVDCLKEVRKQTKARLVVDLQENFLLAESIAPFVDKMRYNPGHLHHLRKEMPIQEKVAWLVSVAKAQNCALRIGVNCGSIAPAFLQKYPDHERAVVESALWHTSLMDKLKFKNFVVSLKDSDPAKVVRCNEEFSRRRPDVPLHLGVTEAGMPPEGIIKTRIAFEKLISKGIGDTLRVSLTLPYNQKFEEINVGRKILADIAQKRFITVPEGFGKGLNIISCPSCSRVENEAFIKLAEEVKEMTTYAKKYQVTIAVMGCRVNGPGETDDADLGLWCGPRQVVLKRKTDTLGSYTYDKILPALKSNLDSLVNLKQLS